MRVDYEAAWVALQGQLAREKSHYGQRELLAKMATLAEEHQVPESLIERASRIFGLPALTRADQPKPGQGGQRRPDSLRDGVPPDDRPTTDQEVVHDGSSTSRNGAEVRF